MFKNIVSDFVDEWKPHCQKLLDRTQEILFATVDESLELMLPANSIRYPALRHLLEVKCQTVASSLIESAQTQVQTHLEIEKHPYTQDNILFDNIAQSRHRALKREIETAFKLDKIKQVVYDTEAIKTIIDGVFERNEQKTVEEHMAEEMEIVLEAYGHVATKRVIDRTPMICWVLVRSLSSSIQESLWNVTDETLSDCMQVSAEFAKAHQALTEELEEMNMALQLFESIL